MTKTVIQAIKKEIWMKKPLETRLLHIYPPVAHECCWKKKSFQSVLALEAPPHPRSFVHRVEFPRAINTNQRFHSVN